MEVEALNLEDSAVSRRIAGSLKKPQPTSSWARRGQKCQGMSGWMSVTACPRASSGSSFSIPRRKSSWTVMATSLPAPCAPDSVPHPGLGPYSELAHRFVCDLLRSALNPAPFYRCCILGSEIKKWAGGPPRGMEGPDLDVERLSLNSRFVPSGKMEALGSAHVGHLELILDDRDVYYIKVCSTPLAHLCLHLPPPQRFPARVPEPC